MPQGVCSVPVRTRPGEASRRVPPAPSRCGDFRMCGCPPQLHRMDPHPHCQHLADQRRPSLCPSSRHLSVAISFCFKLTWAVISAGYPVSKELYSLQLFSACRPLRFDPWLRKIPWRRKWQPTPTFLPRESHGQRSLAGYSPWGLWFFQWSCMDVRVGL